MTVEYLKRGKSDAARAEDDSKTRDVVESTLMRIDTEGDAAVRALSEQFDNYSPKSFRLSQTEIEDLIEQLNAQELSDIKFAQEQIVAFAKAQRASMTDI